MRRRRGRLLVVGYGRNRGEGALWVPSDVRLGKWDLEKWGLGKSGLRKLGCRKLGWRKLGLGDSGWAKYSFWERMGRKEG